MSEYNHKAIEAAAKCDNLPVFRFYGSGGSALHVWGVGANGSIYRAALSEPTT
jgi:hypothetical protein